MVSNGRKILEFSIIVWPEAIKVEQLIKIDDHVSCVIINVPAQGW